MWKFRFARSQLVIRDVVLEVDTDAMLEFAQPTAPLNAAGNRSRLIETGSGRWAAFLCKQYADTGQLLSCLLAVSFGAPRNMPCYP